MSGSFRGAGPPSTALVELFRAGGETPEEPEGGVMASSTSRPLCWCGAECLEGLGTCGDEECGPTAEALLSESKERQLELARRSAGMEEVDSDSDTFELDGYYTKFAFVPTLSERGEPHLTLQSRRLNQLATVRGNASDIERLHAFMGRWLERVRNR